MSVTLVLAVAVSGWAASFINLHAFATEAMGMNGTAAWLVPTTFDGAAAGLSLSAARAASYGRAAGGSRLLVVGFTALSSWINYIHVLHPAGAVVAALLPPSAVVLWEGVMSEMRAAAARRRGHQAAWERAPRPHLLRWCFDFSGTVNLLRTWALSDPRSGLDGLKATTGRAPAPQSAGALDNDPPAIPDGAPGDASDPDSTSDPDGESGGAPQDRDQPATPDRDSDHHGEDQHDGSAAEDGLSPVDRGAVAEVARDHGLESAAELGQALLVARERRRCHNGPASRNALRVGLGLRGVRVGSDKASALKTAVEALEQRLPEGPEADPPRATAG